MTDPLDIPRFPMPEVAKAAGEEVNTVRAWFARKQFLPSRSDRASEGRGRTNLLTQRTAYGLAIAAQLVRQGVPPARAYNIARAFTDTPFHYEHGESRDPGRLFPTGLTVLISYVEDDDPNVHRDGQSAFGLSSGPHRLVRIAPGMDPTEVLFGRNSQRQSAVIVNCNAVCARVDKALGV